MLFRSSTANVVVGIGVLLFAISFQPLILPRVLDCIRSPRDDRIGKIPLLTRDELQEVYQDKRVLVVGGTRGVGFGTALAVASAGADVTVVGRSTQSGQRTMEALKQVAPNGKFTFVQGDLGSVATSKELVNRLEEHAALSQGEEGFDFLVVTAAVFPDWTQPQQQEDGIDKCFAVGVIGRYILYRNMARFMNKKDARVLNVMASGEMPKYDISKEVAEGHRDATSLFESIGTFTSGHEVMLMYLDTLDLGINTTRVSTHPGFLKTDLHRGQGWLMDVMEPAITAVVGISISDCGMKQASILASPKLLQGQQSYVTSDMRGRLTHPKLQALAEKELSWLTAFLQRLVESE